MKSIKIDAGEISICINDDPTRVVTFNPTDVIFVEQFYQVMQEFEDKAIEYEKRFEKLSPGTEDDPGDVEASLKLVREVCDFTRASIDSAFGENTSQVAFGDAMSLNMFVQFFDGITPLIADIRKDKVARYTVSKKKKK